MQNYNIKGQDSKLNALFRLADNLLIFSLVYFFSHEFIGPWLDQFSWSLILLLILYNYFSESHHVYRSWRNGSLKEEVLGVLVSWFASVLIVLLIDLFVFDKQIGYEYDLFWYYLFFFVPVSIVLLHFLVRTSLVLLREYELSYQRYAIYGATLSGSFLRDMIEKKPWSRLVFCGFYDDRTSNEESRRLSLELKGGVRHLIRDCKAGRIDRVYIALSLSGEERVKEILHELSDSTVSVYFLPDMFTFDLLHSRIESYGGIPAISIYESPFSGVDAFVKRVEDIILSSLILLVILVPMLLISIGVKLSSRGPIIFKQKRYGMNGKEIYVWKFRSMTVMENSDKVKQATKNDVRITRFGAILRKTSLDELPQFINVLQGTMSIVGPRPHTVAHNEEYRGLIKGYMLRHKIKPGITGLAQIKGYRGETDTLDKMELRISSDLDYIRNWSVMLDLKIIFLTMLKGFVNKNAY